MLRGSVNSPTNGVQFDLRGPARGVNLGTQRPRPIGEPLENARGDGTGRYPRRSVGVEDSALSALMQDQRSQGERNQAVLLQCEAG